MGKKNKKNDYIAAILSFLYSNPHGEYDKDVIAYAIKCSPSTVYRYCQQLSKAGLIDCRNIGTGWCVSYRYSAKNISNGTEIKSR